MFKVISDIIPHCYDMLNTFIIAIILRNLMKINCALMFIISNHYGRNRLINLLQPEPHSDMFKVISDIMALCYNC